MKNYLYWVLKNESWSWKVGRIYEAESNQSKNRWIIKLNDWVVLWAICITMSYNTINTMFMGSKGKLWSCVGRYGHRYKGPHISW